MDWSTNNSIAHPLSCGIAVLGSHGSFWVVGIPGWRRWITKEHCLESVVGSETGVRAGWGPHSGTEIRSSAVHQKFTKSARVEET